MAESAVQETNPGLSDVAEIVSTRIDLSVEEKALADKITPHLKAILKPEVRQELEVDYIKNRKDFEEQLTADTKKTIEEQIKSWKKEQAPLTKEEIGTLLQQEYSQFTFSLKLKDDKMREFTLVELPQASEIRFLKVLRDKGVPALKDLVNADFKLDGDPVDQLEELLTTSEVVLNVAQELVMIALDPWGGNNITKTWIEENLSSYRVLCIILGQIEVNKYRDFFSHGSRLSKTIR